MPLAAFVMLLVVPFLSCVVCWAMWMWATCYMDKLNETPGVKSAQHLSSSISHHLSPLFLTCTQAEIIILSSFCTWNKKRENYIWRWVILLVIEMKCRIGKTSWNEKQNHLDFVSFQICCLKMNLWLACRDDLDDMHSCTPCIFHPATMTSHSSWIALFPTL